MYADWSSLTHQLQVYRQLVGNKHVFRSLTWISRDSGWPHSLFLPNFLQKMGNRWCAELVARAFQTLPKNRLWQAWWATWPPTWECSTPPRPNRPLSKLNRSWNRSNFSHQALLLFRRSTGAWKSFAMDSVSLLKTTWSSGESPLMEKYMAQVKPLVAKKGYHLCLSFFRDSVNIYCEWLSALLPNPKLCVPRCFTSIKIFPFFRHFK